MTKVAQLNVEELIDELTLAEKISLLAGSDFWHTAAVPRLNIPKVRVSDGPNGVRGTRFFEAVPSNCFPCGTGMAATFNKDLLHEAGLLMGKEARMKGAHVILGPTCNIVRNPLGGRAFESYSEDPSLSGHAASAIINGIQSEKTLACLKHYVCNDQEDERNAVNTVITERALREIYLKPFQLAVRDSNPRSMMSSYNKVNGEHCSQSKKLLNDILREEWGWDGLLMSDWYGVFSTEPSLKATLNLEMPGISRFRNVDLLSHMVNSKEINIEVIDTNVRQVLKFVNEAIASGIPEDADELANANAEASQTLRDVGDESIVLLKNQDNVLPISKSKAQKIAVIGPNVKVARYSGGGSASLTANYTVTPWDGIKKKVEEGGNQIELSYTIGAQLDKNLRDIGTILTNEDGSEGFKATYFFESSENSSRTPFYEHKLNSSKILLADFKHEKLAPGQLLYYAVFEGYYTPELTGTYEVGCSACGTAQIFIDDKLVVDNKTNQVAGDAFFLGYGTREERSEINLEAGKKYKITVDFGTSITSKLDISMLGSGGVNFGIDFKVEHEAELAKAVALAKEADTVIIVAGLTKEWETEGFDRPNMDIPGYTNELIEEVAKVNSRVVVVNQSGSAVTMPWVNEIEGLVQAWYGGSELGNTIADVVFGDVNPSGKMPVTFPERIQDIPSYLNYASTNGEVLYGEDIFVGYRYFEKMGTKALFPFGFGLSYTSFEFGNLVVSTDDANVNVKVDVTNTGSVDGSEVIQIYVGQEDATIMKPVKELRDFAKVSLAAGEKKTVSVAFPIKEATSYWNVYKDKWESSKGIYTVSVGNSSDNANLTATFEVAKTTFFKGV